MPKIYLIPNHISPSEPVHFAQKHEVAALRVFFVEEIKSARRLLKMIDPGLPLGECVFYELNEHTPPEQNQKDFAAVKGQDMGVISESGCPCVADPGAALVALAHEDNYEIIPLVGPSSILLALMASGLNGQNFAFNGYLPKDRDQRIKKIKDLETRSLNEGQTQIVMEAPYRNQNMLEDLLRTCQPQTRLCVAVQVGSPSALIKTRRIKDWRQNKLDINKKPALFLFLR